MEPIYTITLARAADVEALPQIELSAATMLRGHVPPSILEESIPEPELRQAQQEGRLWVALADDVPVGFALVKMLAEDLPHLHEMDVSPQHGRRGLGTALLKAVFEWLARSGHRQLTLTTFRAVPWNMPFYSRLGFEEIHADELRPELQAIVRDEAGRGLDPARRVVMKYRVIGS
jgi:GNAT superfamily N-acetyltransferase